MAKGNYTSKIAEQAMAFSMEREPEVTQETKPSVESQQTQNEANTNRYEPDQDSKNQDEYCRMTYYITYEQIAALDELRRRTGISKSEILRQILEAGLEAVAPGIFEETRGLAEELKGREKVKRTKNNDKSLLNTLRAKLG